MTGHFWRQHRVTIALLALALLFYAVGYRKGSVVAIAIGAGLEIAFWVKLWRGGAGGRDDHRR